MRHGNRQLPAWRLVRIALLFAGLLFGQAALAQSGPPQVAIPPVRTTIDANGVDLFRGTLSFSQNFMQLGSGNVGIGYSRSWIGNGTIGLPGWRDTLVGGINQNASEYTVSIGDNSESFTLSGTTYTNDQGSGSTLAFDSGSNLYTYTTTGGMIATFDHSLVNPGIAQYGLYSANTALLTKIIYQRNALILTYNYETDTFCVHSTLGTCDTYAQAIRLSDLESISGYRLELHHVRDAALPPLPGPALAALPAWLTPASVTGESMIDCVPGHCSTPATPYPVVTISSATSGSDTIWTIGDPMSRQWRYDVDANNNLVGVYRPTNTGGTANTAISYYGSGVGFAAGRVQTYTQDGRTWTYQFSENTTTHTVTSIVCDPSIASASCSSSNYTQQYVFDETTTQPISVAQTTNYTGPVRSTYAYSYDTYGRLTKAQAPEGNFTTYGYDSNGNLTSTVTTPKGSTDTACGSGHSTICTTAVFPHCPGVNCANPSQTIDANGNSTFYAYDPGYGYLKKVEYPAPTPGNGPETDYTYANFYAYYLNSSGVIATSGSPIIMLTKATQCRTVITCSGTVNETASNYNYANASSPTVGNNLNLLTKSTGAGDGSLTATSTMVYDHIGNMTSVDGPLPGTDDTTVSFYDADRERVGVIGAAPGLSSGLPNRAVRLTYNNDGQVTSVEKGTTSGQSSSAWSAFTPLEQSVATYGSDALKATDQILDFSTSGHPAFVLMQYNYDGVGRSLCSTVRMNTATYSALPDACALATTSTTFGPDRISKTTYDAASRATLIQQAYGTSDANNYAAFAYTVNGQLNTLTDANTNVTTYTYDGFDRADKTQYPNPSGGGSSSTDYEENLLYDANGNVTSFHLRDGNTVTMGYDVLNRLTGRSGATIAARTYAYNNLSQLTGSTLTSTSQSASFTYDALGRITAETSPLGTMTTGYDLAGRRTSLAWPDSFSVTYARYVTGDLSSVYENGTGGISLATYGYDSLGRVNAISAYNSHGQTYAWDSADRLTAFSSVIAAGTTTAWISYSPSSQIYQRNTSNDLLSSNVAYNVNRSYSANGLNQYTKAGAPGLSYDANGNLTRLASSTFAYDGDNMLNGGSAGTGLTYDPLNNLYQTPDDGGTRLAYSGGMIVGEFNSSGALKRRYVPGDGVDNPVFWYEGSGTTDRRYLEADERGSIAEVSNGIGTVAINRYDEWGIPAGANAGRFGYTGQTWLPSVQAWNYKARIYNPIVGRFQQSDPIGYSDGPNWYSYVQDDPINLIDPLGTDCTDYNYVYRYDNGDLSSKPGYTVRVCTGSTGADANGSATNENGNGGPDIIVTGKRVKTKIGFSTTISLQFPKIPLVGSQTWSFSYNSFGPCGSIDLGSAAKSALRGIITGAIGGAGKGLKKWEYYALSGGIAGSAEPGGGTLAGAIGFTVAGVTKDILAGAGFGLVTAGGSNLFSQMQKAEKSCQR